ncbi:MAG: hypothetical protein HQL69_06165 [Magnetococcales bacterium]|nr:hypothetical protein [Magnetococcales bacterium]
MENVVNLMELATKASVGQANVYEIMRLSQSQTPMVLFTPNALKVGLHFHENQYCQCNGKGCLLCQLGRKRTDKYVMPIYLPETMNVALLPITDHKVPGSLLPQLTRYLSPDTLTLVFVSRVDNAHFHVESGLNLEETPQMLSTIQHFNSQVSAGNVDLANVFPQFTNEELAKSQEIALLMRLKGISLP